LKSTRSQLPPRSPYLCLSLGARLLTCLALCTLIACGEPDGPAQPAQPTEPAPPPSFSLSRSPEELKLSEEVVSFGGSNLISELTDQVKSVTSRLLSAPLDLKEMWLKTYTQTSFLFAFDHVDEARPLRFIQLLHQGEVHTVRLIGIKDLEALKASIGSYLDELKEEGVTLYAQRRYKQDTEPLYFTVLSHNMIASSKVKALLSASHRAMYEQLASVRLSGLGGVHLYPKRVLSGWGDQLLVRGEERLEELEFKGPAPSQERQRALLGTGAQWLRALANGSERVVLSARFTEDRLRVQARWKAIKGSTLEGSFKGLEAGPHTLLSLLSEPSPFALSLNLKPHQLAQLTAFLNEGAFTRALLRDQEGLLKEYITKAVTAAAHLKGQLLFAALTPPPQPAPPPKEAPQGGEAPPADQAVLDALKRPVTKGHLRWAAWMSHTGQAGTVSSLDALWALYQQPELTQALKRAGVYSKVSADELKSGVIEGLPSTHIKARMPRTSRALAPLRPQLKELYDAHVAVGPELVGVGFGPDWQDSLRAIKAPLDTKRHAPVGVSKATQAGAPGSFLFMYLNPIALLSHLKQGRGGSMLLPLQLMAQGLSADEGLSLSAGASDGSATLVLSLPFSLLNALGKGFAGMGLTPSAPPTAP